MLGIPVCPANRATVLPSLETVMDRRHPSRLRNRPVAASIMSRRAALQGAALAGASLALLAAIRPQLAAVTAAQSASPPPEWFGLDATTDRHGQVILGEGPIYLSHLPFFMFATPGHHPHHYQTILEVSLPEEAMESYLADKAESDAPLYTFHPTTNVAMLDLILPAPSGAAAPSLTGKIVRGHWERGGEPQPFGITFGVVHDAVPATVERVVYAHEFAFDPPRLEQLEYVLFGAGDRLFLAHRITAPPDFDQLLPVTIAPGTFTDEQLQSGVILSVPERANSIAERLRDGDEVAAVARHAGTGVALGTDIPIAAGREIFFEESELLEDGFLGHTQEEIDAGFGFP